MDHSRYQDFVIRAANKERDVHSRIMLCAHRVILQQEHLLALAWPDMRRMDFGYVCRVFGNQAALDALLAEAAPLFASELIRCYPAGDTPAAATTIAYIRDRMTEKFTESWHQKRIRRFAHLGDNPPPRKQGEAKCHHTLNVQSASNGHRYNIHIRTHTIAPDDAGGRHYGLGYTLPRF